MVDAMPTINPLALPNLPLCPTSAMRPSHTKSRCVGLCILVKHLVFEACEVLYRRGDFRGSVWVWVVVISVGGLILIH